MDFRSVHGDFWYADDDPAESSGGGGASPRSPRHLLLIEDETTLRTALRRFFGRLGWEVEEAESGTRALELLLGEDAHTPQGAASEQRPHHYDLVLSDVRMPGLNGVQLYERLKAERPDVLPKLVFATGDVIGTETVELLRNWGCPVVQKPFKLAHLQELADRLTKEAP